LLKSKSIGKARRAFLVIDEGDSLAGKRSQEHSHHEDKVAVNTLIQNIDNLRQDGGRILVFVCTNRLSAIDPAVLRRAALVEEFSRPTKEDLIDLFENDFQGLETPDFKATDTIPELVDIIVQRCAGGALYTYSDVRQRLYPAVIAKTKLERHITYDDFLEAIKDVSPSPVVEDK
jgi:SpoVK/Ycf46/Vps4 family AAA+-type ATPase